MSVEVDTETQRPRTPNDQYTRLTEQQIRNIKKDPSPFFHSKAAEPPTNTEYLRQGGRAYLDRYCSLTSKHLTRGPTGTHSFGWIDNKWNRNPPEGYNTCRGRAAVRWGPNKAGERTRSHFFGEGIDRYTTIDMYRRNPTNYPGKVVMDCGRPGDGYYAQKYPSRTTWFGFSGPLNRTDVMDSVYRKTSGEYKEIEESERQSRASRTDRWPEYSEYTGKYSLREKTEPKLTGLQEKKKHIEASLVGY